MSESRADSFLHLIRRSSRGRLKIYLGYCAGVGKTYQMLLEGRRLKEDGMDVVAGIVETHGRKETEELLRGLTLLPRRSITYRGIEIGEMDLDALLARRPAVALVDELAHTNAPGSRNAKRFEDVEELLEAGIHVISTLNIQHLESLYETVERATGVKVRERIPDHVVLEADQVVNVDIATEDLRRRLQEGKVYTPDRIETALDHFFKTTNLEQLRELTMSELASQIDSRLREPQDSQVPSIPDQVMVALSSKGPNAGALLRYASRLAGRLNRSWYAVYVQTSSEGPTVIDAETQRLLSDTLTLARQLGATVFTYKGEDIVQTILQFAKEYRVGHIVIGSPIRKPSFWKNLLGRSSITERLALEGRGVTLVIVDTRDIHMPQSTPEPAHPPKPAADPRGGLWRTVLHDSPVVVWNDAVSMEDALRELVAACARRHPELAEGEAWKNILERERQGATFVTEDMAIPHARMARLAHPLLAVGVSRLGIPDPASGAIARILVLMLSPLEDPDLHVRLLGQIGRMARDDAWHRDMLGARTPDEVARILRDRAEAE
jgi:two-component system, OmpR family, sensor histidine kinase KdpD